MIYHIFSVYDSKAAYYMQPFYFQTQGEALRAFMDTCDDHEHAFYRHAADFTLFYIGSFNNEDAEFTLKNTPEPVAKALSFRNPETPSLVKESI